MTPFEWPHSPSTSTARRGTVFYSDHAGDYHRRNHGPHNLREPRLLGQPVVVIGGNSGIGLAMA